MLANLQDFIDVPHVCIDDMEEEDMQELEESPEDPDDSDDGMNDLEGSVDLAEED
jgi:hypothetical protein